MPDDREPWNQGVRGQQVLPLINLDCEVLRVPAGPGTGKTFGLKRRVVRILHPDGLGVASHRVLVCTFNRVIADELREEIAKELEPYGLDSPDVRTVRALAAGLANQMLRFLLPEESEAMIYDVRHAHPGIDELYDRTQSRAMRALREHEAGVGEHTALATAVRQWLTDHGVSLIGDLPRAVEAQLRGGDFGDQRYDHIIIDEFQDLTEVEIRLLLGLGSASVRIVAVGDRKQSIYAFRGNEGGGLEALPAMVGHEVTDHTMDECQRCPGAIVRLANDVMSIYNEPLRATQDNEGFIYQVHHRTPAAEQARIAREVVRTYRERPQDRHLVLVTRRKWGYDLRNAIRAIDASIQAPTVFSEDVLETWPTREAFIFLSIVGNGQDAAAMRDWISYREPDSEGRNWKAPHRNAAAYAWIKDTQGVLDIEKVRALAQLNERDLSGSGRGYVLGRLRRLVDLLESLPADANPADLVDHVLNPNLWVTDSSPEFARDDILRLHAEATELLEADSQLSIGSLVDRLRYRIATRQPLGVEEQPGIRIVTMWGAKGLTADFVYITGLCDEALPGPYDTESTGLTAGEYELEQLRLLYVSLTRAKKALVVSRPLKIKRGQVKPLHLSVRSAGSRFWQDLAQCRFFADIPAGHLPNSAPGESWLGNDLSVLE